MESDFKYLLDRINKQHPSAYRRLYEDYYKSLVFYAMNFISNKQASEDIVQDLFATMWEKKMTFLSFPSFRSYLYNSVRNASLNYLKHQNVESTYVEHIAATYKEVSNDDDINIDEVYRWLFQTIDQLPERCREIFLMHMDGKRNEEIASLLHLSVETVKTQKKRAMQYLRSQVETCSITAVYCSILLGNHFID